MKVSPDKKIKVTPVLANMTVGKPSRTSFFMVRSGEGWDAPELQTFTPESRSKDSQPYLVEDDYQQIFEEKGVLVPAKFYMYIVYTTNVMKIDLISQKTDKAGNLSKYHSSRMECYEAAKTQWVQMHANMDAGYYSWTLAQSILPAPVWSEKPSNIYEAIELAFKGFIIDSPDHPEIKKLKGIL